MIHKYQKKKKKTIQYFVVYLLTKNDKTAFKQDRRT